ncbi:hypothetical protein [Methylobacterium sp. Leaf118]|uniref:hypothetical protein n=1 Tax=Methylobacterium sp. Leaf118 TaxID=2876562 RepID=UPI001E329C2F|nr:hypothetical protein [Methylobacterium sp. Leaf118]
MSLLRVLAFGTITGLGSLSVALVSADRLAHTAAPPAAPSLRAAIPSAPEPTTTGSVSAGPVKAGTVTQGPATPEPPKGRMVSGFDTERLNALMRGEAAPAARKR